jgi:dephospho-CoA kinase
MLEHLGAYGIDADALSHRAFMKGAPGYQPVIDTFGKWILAPDGQIDRAKLGKLVFANPEAMASLEAIIHPLVRQAVNALARRAKQDVIVIEAIKLLEGELHKACDAIWVTAASQENQISRLVQKRGMDVESAKERVFSQGAQQEKIQAADVVIQNNGSFEHTWEQVSAAWKGTVSTEAVEYVPVKSSQVDELVVQRAGPGEAEEIAAFITQISDGSRRMTRLDVMAAFGEKAFLLLRSAGEITGILGWQVENLVARVDDFFVEDKMPLTASIKAMIGEVEAASKELQCEAALLFLSPDLAQHRDVWRQLGYTARTVKELDIRAWQEAAMESMPPGTVLYFRQLREDRVLRPV